MFTAAALPSPIRFRRFVVLCAVLAGFANQSFAQVDKGITLVKADLLADTSAVVPGKAFTVGLRLKMAPHWHTYWQYSGDAGLPTTINWTLPAGYEAGPIQWPLPEKIVSPGDIINYGYSDEVVLLTEIKPPAQPASGSEVTLNAKATWLVCDEKCIPGSAELSLKLPTAADAQAANTEVFAKYRARLPLTTLPEGAKLESAAGTDRLYHDSAFVFDVQTLNMGTQTPEQSKSVDFYPLPDENTELGHPEVIVRDNFFYEIRLPVVSEPKLAARFDGVLVAGLGDERRGWLVKGATLWPKMAVPPAASPAAASDTPPGTAVVQTKPPSASTPSGPAAPTGSLWHFLLLGFLGGLILNVMPCVLPVISLKLFSFVKQANEAPGRVFRLGLAYAAGVFAWFMGFASLVVAVKAAGGRQIGYSFQLQNPWFLLGLIVVSFVFALNLLGVFEFILPGGVTNAAGNAAARSEGYSGAFLQGLLATVLGSACTAPIFVDALSFAFSQNGPVILTMFAAIAAGMSAPFVLLAAFPRWLRFIPKPGVWMERVKQGTGFLMLATVLWLLWTFGGNRRSTDAVVWAGALLLVLGVACWVQGAFNTLVSSDRSRWASRAVIAALVFGGGWFCVNQIVRAEPVADVNNASFATQLSNAQKTGRLVFVDFTARWCAICQSNKKFVIDTDPVQKALADRQAIFLTADYTAYSDDIGELLRRFNAPSVPLYVVYPAGKPDAPIVLPTLLTQQAVLDALTAAAPQDGAGKPLAAR